MTILALDFSSDTRSVAVVRGTATLGRAQNSGGRRTRAFATIENALRDAGLEREAIDCIALGLGPGSYAGIRVAIAIAQGWELARGIRLVGVPAAEGMAEQARHAGRRGRLHIVIDAQRGDLYHAQFELDDGAAHPIAPVRLATPDSVQQAAGPDPVVAWPECVPLYPGAVPILPDAGALGRLAAARSEFPPDSQLEPVYLRETTFVKAPPPRFIPT